MNYIYLVWGCISCEEGFLINSDTDLISAKLKARHAFEFSHCDSVELRKFEIGKEYDCVDSPELIDIWED